MSTVNCLLKFCCTNPTFSLQHIVLELFLVLDIGRMPYPKAFTINQHIKPPSLDLVVNMTYKVRSGALQGPCDFLQRTWLEKPQRYSALPTQTATSHFSDDYASYWTKSPLTHGDLVRCRNLLWSPTIEQIHRHIKFRQDLCSPSSNSAGIFIAVLVYGLRFLS